MARRAKIVATLGPASADEAVIRGLLDAGADVIRINLSHGEQEEHRRSVGLLRRIASEQHIHLPIIFDLMGPRYRLGDLPSPLDLESGQTVRLGSGGTGVDLPVDDPALLAALSPGERVLVADGLVELAVVAVGGPTATATVVNGGRVTSRKGINLPDSELPFAISDKDLADLRLAVELEVDYLAVSYVSGKGDLVAIRTAVGRAGGKIPLIAKLERSLAVRHLEDLVGEADAVMVARGDLGVEVPLHDVPILQKKIIDSGRRHGKPVIVATQMLESMIERPRPTRAETSDVANAVFDGADALMLSGESAVGAHPVEAVTTMARIIIAAEAYGREVSSDATSAERLAAADLPGGLDPGVGPEDGGVSAFEIADTVAAAAVHAASTLDLAHIVAFSQGGFTARVISRYRPAAPVWILTTDKAVARRVQLSWGVRPLLLEGEVENHDEVVDRVDRELLRHGLAQQGDAIAVLMGDPIRRRPLTNLVRLHRVSVSLGHST